MQEDQESIYRLSVGLYSGKSAYSAMLTAQQDIYRHQTPGVAIRAIGPIADKHDVIHKAANT